MDITYRREGRKPFPEMLEAVERTVRSCGFDVVRTHDLQATLAAKGFDIQPLVVIDIALPGLKGTCMLHVYNDGESVWVSAIRPLALWREIGMAGTLSDAEADEAVISLVDAACS